MRPAFLLDTSFLISLVDDARANHSVARAYYEQALLSAVPLYVSTIALAEFAQKQNVEDLPLSTFVVLPFNVLDATLSGKIAAYLMPSRDFGDDRNAVRADIHLIAQAARERIPFILSEDRNSLAKYVERAKAAGFCDCRSVLLADGFDGAWFHGGQGVLSLP